MTSHTFKDQRDQSVIMVAVQFDERLASLLQAATVLARPTGASLRLVHVCDPWTKSYLATAVEAGTGDLVQVLKDEAVRVAHRRLEAVRTCLDPELSVELVVLEGDVVHALAHDADTTPASMLVIGASRGGLAGTSAGFSTAISLIGETSVPVLVLNETAALRGSGGGLRLLVADDLTEVGAAALTQGLRLACVLTGSTLVHAHVESNDAMQQLGRAARRQSAISSIGSSAATVFGPQSLAEAQRRGEEAMRRRAGNGPEQLAARGGRYVFEQAAGAVPEELERTACAYGIDLAIFGQHRVFHRQTMHAGQVPFKAMLSQTRPVLVVPPQG